MKRFKLLCHNKSKEDSILLNPKDFQNITVGSIVEICPPEGEYSPLLLQVTSNSFANDLPHKDTILLEPTVATNFHLKQLPEVIVNVVEDIKAVSLDSVEITFRDQYLARSDMWRLKKRLANTCVYLNKNIEIYGIRCQIFEMYRQGEKVSSGVVTEETKIVFRSSSSMVYLFIQMSCEMWHFDINGDLYFEKAIDGFLPDLFSKWKKLSCNHDVTIVLFSRTFYEAQSSDEFPPYMRECLQRDYKGRFFEDFYRIAVQNERYDEWSSTIISLKKLFNQYQDAVLRYHERPDVTIPKAVNSTSSQGNFLEVLNMSLNVFEKHYMDRSFDRTGQLSIVISPGVGMFEVDRELTIITKQRIIDNGIGSDLVCLGEQPLHAVPLFKFHNKKVAGTPHPIADDYNMPHWINLSFYASSKHPSYLSFVPRVKLPIPLREEHKETNLNDSLSSNRSRHCSQPEPSFPVLFDYDEYDAQVFRLPAHVQVSKNTSSLQRPRRRKGTPPNQSHSVGAFTVHHPVIEESISVITSSDPSPLSVSHASSAAIAIPSRSSHAPSSASSYQNSSDADMSFLHPRQYSKDDTDPELTPPFRTIVGSAGGSCENQFAKQILTRRPKALVNPFDPSHITIKLTSNRRRWTHVFPLGPTGIFMQQHHYQAIPQISASTLIAIASTTGALSPENLLQYRNTISSLELDGSFDSKIGVVGKRETFSSANTVNLCDVDVKSPASNLRVGAARPSASQSTRSLSWLWGATGEQEWTPALTTGVDWKSLVIPACLPITTDYFPDIRSLQNDYLLSTYFLLPEDIIAENSRPKIYQNEEEKLHRTLTTQEVYVELICQRLQQGFQIIMLSKQSASYLHPQAGTSPQFSPTVVRGKQQQQTEDLEEVLLSIGRLFHRLTLDGCKITVTQYRPRHPYREIKIHYCYRFHAPDSDTYGVSWVDFTSEKLENYAWNYLDNYICMKGEGEYELKDSLKFWRLRMLVLPEGQVATRKIIEGTEFCECDLYKEFSHEEKIKQQSGFLKFVEILNGIRRLNPKHNKILSLQNSGLGSRRSSLGQSVLSQLVSNTSRDFRERVSSNRIHDRPIRFRSQSAKNGARVETPITGRVSPAFEVDTKLTSSSISLETPLEGGEGGDEAEVKKLNLSSGFEEILDAMKAHGMNFLCKVGLPNCTFTSAEAVLWAVDNIEGMAMSQAIQLFQDMVDKGYICHASCIKKHPFIYGFYLYYIVPPLERDVSRALLFDADDGEFIYLFQRDWIEVVLLPLLPSSSADRKYPTPEEICVGNSESNPKLKFKTTSVHIDEGMRSNRQEWGQARYQNIYKPYEAFEIVLEWMVATGNIAADMVLGWARKALPSGLQVVPIPSDPFALPFSPDSDPLRGPIFIPLDLTCITENLMQNLDNHCIQLLQEKILCKFGFLKYPNPVSPFPPRYVHISGSMFIMLPEFQREKKNVSTPAMDLHHVSSPHDEYITRHFSGLKRKRSTIISSDSETKVGFLYSWNYMITKRWKNCGTVDENFMRKVMRDFRAFCSNQNNRLEELWKCSLMSGFSQDQSLALSLEC